MAIRLSGTNPHIITMTDAEFLQLNGVAAASGIPVSSPFYGLGYTPTSATGTTTLTMPDGSKDIRKVEAMLRTLRRASQSYRITIQP